MSEEEPNIHDIPLEARMALASIKIGGAQDVVEATIKALEITKAMGETTVPIDNVINALNRVFDSYSLMVSDSVL